MHNIFTSPSPGRGAELSRTVARLREQDMAGFRITADDFDLMKEVARVSSYRDGALRWTELAVYYRPGQNRPFVVVSEGHSRVAGEKLRRQYAAMGTLDRAMNWFEGSELRDELAAAVDRWTDGATEWQEKIDAMVSSSPTEIHPRPDSILGGNAKAARARRGWSALPSPDLPSFTAALAWLYPGDDLSERARALAFERDFGMPERTVRNTLAIEAGRVEGKVGPWVQPLLVALRWFDRVAWEKSRG